MPIMPSLLRYKSIPVKCFTFNINNCVGHNVNVNILFWLQAVYNRREEFFLFGSVMEATMIDKR
jgi:hypothetical protein